MKLHLGCGKRDFGPSWIHIDCGDFPHVSSHSITELPFDDNSCELIYASHVVEYFDREEVIPLLTEWRRVLVHEGILRLAVPNFMTMVQLYLDESHSLETFLGPLYGKMQPPDHETIYHKTVYDYNSVKQLLESIGFVDVRRYDWRETEHSHIDDHSQAYIPHMDKENGTLISLNVEATKVG
jgi:predicted SAM-dependent methyltransferase